MKFSTHYKRQKSKRETFDKESKVQTAGYIPAKDQIFNLIQAGKRLDQFRQDQYDFKAGEEIDENYEDPTRSPGFDLADASQIKNTVEPKLKEVAKAKKAKTKKAESKAKKTLENVDESTLTADEKEDSPE